MELRHLTYFVALAEELHFTRAAAKLHIAQPALSNQIRALERELSVVLVNRSKRGITLTDAGRAFLDRARVILSEVDRARQSARQAARGEMSGIQVGFITLANDVLLSSIRDHERRFPDITFSLRQIGSVAQATSIASGTMDIGLLAQVIPDERLRFDLVARQPLGVILPMSHRLAAQKTVALRDLALEALVIPPAATPYVATFMAACAELGFTPRVVQRAAIQSAHILVATGVGLFVAPCLETSRYPEDVVQRPLRAPDLSVDVFAARRAKPPSPQLDAFVKTLRRKGGVGGVKADR